MCWERRKGICGRYDILIIWVGKSVPHASEIQGETGKLNDAAEILGENG